VHPVVVTTLTRQYLLLYQKCRGERFGAGVPGTQLPICVAVRK